MFTKRALLRLIGPLIIEQILAATIGIADTMMVSSVGKAAVSGISLVDAINLLLVNVFAALATGGSIVAAQYLGKEDKENAGFAAKQLLLVTAAVSMMIMVVCLIGRSGLLLLLFESAEDAVMQSANTYFWLSALSYPFIAIYNACAALFRAQGNSRISMLASLVMNGMNVAGNALFIYGFHFGVAGAGLSTLLSRFAGAALLLVMLRNPMNRISVNLFEDMHSLRPQPTMIKRILLIGVPNGLESGMFHVGKIMMAGLITTFGTVAITANAIANTVMTLAQMPGQAINLSMVTVVGNCVGARQYDQAKRYILMLSGVTYVLMGIVNVLTFFGLPGLIRFYHMTPEINALAMQLSLCCLIGHVTFWPGSFTLPNGLRAAGDVRYTMIISILSMWVFRVGLSFLIGKMLGVGALGIWIAMLVDWIFRMIMFSIRFFSGKWKNRAVV